MGASEITDKGGVNRRDTLANRAHLVEALYRGITDFLEFSNS